MFWPENFDSALLKPRVQNLLASGQLSLFENRGGACLHAKGAAVRPTRSRAALPTALELRTPEQCTVRTKKPVSLLNSRALGNNAGSDLLSHTLSHAVPSAVSGLTSVFGMGTGVTLIL